MDTHTFEPVLCRCFEAIRLVFLSIRNQLVATSYRLEIGVGVEIWARLVKLVLINLADREPLSEEDWGKKKNFFIVL